MKVNSTLDYKRYFGKNSLNIALGFEQNSLSTSFNTTNGINFFSNSLRAKGLNLHRDMTTLKKLDGQLNQLSAVLNLDYSYDSKFGVKANLRPDFISRFVDGPLWYYSASAYVDFRNLFFPASSSVSNLVLRGGYGTAGKVSHMPYAGEPVVEYGSEPYYEGLNRLYTCEANLAVETSFINGRIGLTAGIYDRRTDDIYSMFCFGQKSGELWTSAPRSDVFNRKSRIGNKGFEFELYGEPVCANAVKWTVSANLAVNANELLEVCADDRFIGTIGSNTVANINSAGLPVGTYYGWDSVAAAYGPLAVSPKLIYGGLSSTLKVYGFTFDITFDGTAGNKLLNLGKVVAEQKSPYTISERYVEDADFLRLGRASLAYDFKFAKAKWVRNFRVFLSAHNIMTLSSYSGWNPDVDIDYGAFPQTRTVTAGFNIAF